MFVKFFFIRSIVYLFFSSTHIITHHIRRRESTFIPEEYDDDEEEYYSTYGLSSSIILSNKGWITTRYIQNYTTTTQTSTIPSRSLLDIEVETTQPSTMPKIENLETDYDDEDDDDYSTQNEDYKLITVISASVSVNGTGKTTEFFEKPRYLKSRNVSLISPWSNRTMINLNATRGEQNESSNILSQKIDCSIGHKSCEECKAISPHCHYNYKKQQCIYSEYTHQNQIYECSKRWFAVESFNGMYVAIFFALLFSVAFGIYFLCLYYMKVFVVEAVPREEVNRLRNQVRIIRQRRNKQQEIVERLFSYLNSDEENSETRSLLEPQWGKTNQEASNDASS